MPNKRIADLIAAGDHVECNQANWTVKGNTIEIVGIGGLGVLRIQFAKALGYQVAAIANSDAGLKLAIEVPKSLTLDIIVGFNDLEAS